MPGGSLMKYFDQKGGPEQGMQLTWPGTMDGFPIIGDAANLNLKQEETAQIPLRLDFHSKEFYMWDPESKKEFDLVMDRIVNGLYMQHQRENVRTPEGRLVWLEWVQIYGEISNDNKAGANFSEARSRAIQLGAHAAGAGQGG